MMNVVSLAQPRAKFWFGSVLLIGTMGCANIAGINEAQLQSNQGVGGAPSNTDPNLCTTYCNTVMVGCTGDLAVYVSPETCFGVCERLVQAGRAGTPGAIGENTVHCRLEEARSAKSTGEDSTYCFAAGPGGGNDCGTDCEGFCVLLKQTCPNEFNGPQFNGSLEYCLRTACPAIPTLDAGYNSSQESGNNLNCRLYHVSAANADSQAAGIHCPHAAGAKPCAD
jgi:hypothetical protein